MKRIQRPRISRLAHILAAAALIVGGAGVTGDTALAFRAPGTIDMTARAEMPRAHGADAQHTQSLVSKVQYKLPFGMSAEGVRERLHNDGYTDIEVTYVGLLDSKAEACREGTKYRVKLKFNGTYEYRNAIGKCRRRIASNEVERLIERQGFQRVDMENDGELPYRATACRNGDRFAIEVDAFGDVKAGGRVGRCDDDGRTPRDIRRELHEEGYNRITFTDRQPPRYVVEACRGDRRVRLHIGRRGRVRNEEAIGRCPLPIKAEEIEPLLEKAGFDRVDIVDRKPPRYSAEACRGEVRMRIAINPWGERINEEKIGECAPPVTVASLEETLRNHDRDFRNIRVREVRGRYPFIATVCHQDKQVEMYFTRYGRFEQKKDLGACPSPGLGELLERFSARGMTDAEAYIEGCRQGRKIRVKLDRFGEVRDREFIGRCDGRRRDKAPWHRFYRPSDDRRLDSGRR